MKHLIAAIMITATTLVSASCKKDVTGEGPISTRTRSVQSFTAIDLQMNGNVYYTKSNDLKLEVTAKETIHGRLETNVVNGQLIIRYSNGKTYDADESIRINISGPDVRKFQLNTSGSIQCLNDIYPGNLDLSTSGSGSIWVKGSESLDVTIKGSGSVYFSGQPYISTHISGTGRLVRVQ